MHRSAFLRFAALALLALLPALGWAQLLPAPVAGQHYQLIEGGQPYRPVDGKIEVVEVFAYACGHCAHFQPLVNAWKSKLPADVRFSYVPLPVSRDDAFARGFFAAADAGALTRVHDALFAAVHDQQSVPKNPTSAELAAFYAKRGLDGKKIQAAMDSPAMADRLAQAYRFAARNQVPGTPALVVNGRYLILGDSYQALLQNADRLIVWLRVQNAASKPSSR